LRVGSRLGVHEQAVISVIEDRAVVKRILDHLGLRSTAAPIAVAQPHFDARWVDDVPQIDG
jgi:hypothetical protein